MSEETIPHRRILKTRLASCDALTIATATDGIPQQPFAFLSGLLAHMEENCLVFRNVVGRRSGFGVERRFMEMVFQLVEQDLAKQNIAEDQRPMLARWLTVSIVGLMACWVDTTDAPAMAVLEQFMLSSSLLKISK